MKILALEPFYGGSHKAFLDGWRDHSQHEFTIMGLPAHKWKWRMRHAPVTFAEHLGSNHVDEVWDLLWCTDMLNLAAFLGLAYEHHPELVSLPRVAYFHENQLTYPVREEKERDLHFAYSNFTTALAADQVWFNSRFHRAEFVDALRSYLKRMPDHQSLDAIDRIAAKSLVHYPGIDEIALPALAENCDSSNSGTRPLHIGWASRWEHDKNPDDFFAALRILKSNGVRFRLTVLGQSFRSSPPVFEAARAEFQNEVENWGFVESRDSYHGCLSDLDVIVSTANHEFFGIGVVEAIRCGAFPLLPNRLAYPEVLNEVDLEGHEHLYDGSVQDLARQLTELAKGEALNLRQPNSAGRFTWPVRAAELDKSMELLMARASKTR